MFNNEETRIYEVVMNHEGQYSIRPPGRRKLPGWQEVGMSGLKSDCLAYIKKMWTDIRPLSLREQAGDATSEVKESQADCPGDACIHYLFEKQAARIPDATAVVFEDKQLTYAELNCRANQLARYLLGIGLKPGEKVGLCVERSLDMAVGMLGILKAGGVYVPLDPAYPQDRLALLIQETQLEVLLTQKQLQIKFPEMGARIVFLDSPSVYGQDGENLDSVASPSSLAYVIHTSGSTGMPKGVMVMHLSLWHYAQDLQEKLEITSDDRYLHTASIAFSSSVRQLMVPLSLGASVAITTAEEKINPLALFELIKRRNVTVMDTVPTFWQTCCEALAGLEPRSRQELLNNKLRLIQTTGEPLSYGIVSRWRLDFKHPARLFNMYGATETSGSIALYPITDEVAVQTNLVPLGVPVVNAQMYLLDAALQPVSEGASGEIYLAGPRAALGYLNRPELTAENFIPDPFSKTPGARMWKTGDLARYLPDGNLGFIGRIDYQINMRGIRVEPGEIEFALSDHPAIRRAVVIGRNNDHGEKFLAAYLTCDPDSSPSVSHLRDYLQGKIPDHMIPTSFVVLNAMPLTSSGKIDRKALPAPDKTRPNLESPFVPARTPVEETLVGIWSRILGVDQVGIYDNFLELGGTSLMGTRVISHIRDIYRMDFNLRLVLEKPTVSELAVAITQRSAEQTHPKNIDRVLSELEMLSDEEAQQILLEEERMTGRRE